MRGLAFDLRIHGIAAALVGICALVGTNSAAEKTEPKLRDKNAWAWQSPARPAVPTVKNSAWVRNPIDAFILAKLESQNLAPAEKASRAVLIRRLSFDLVGLPPTLEEIDAFVNDPAADAYEKVVDRLLASPRYGERWAIHWLDLVRYAETDGFKADDPRPEAWRYRDYVINALNDDKPYDRFVKEQLAGDEFYPEDGDAWIATGFLRHYPDEYNAVNLEQRRQEIVNDITDTTSQVFLGVTLACARCHDHKFDPITLEDYYRFQAFFAAFQPTERPVGDTKERQDRQREWEEKTSELRQRMAQLEEPYHQQFHDKRKARFTKELQALLDIPADRRTPLQRQLAAMEEKQVISSSEEAAKSMKPEIKKEWQELAKQLAEFAPLKPHAPPTAMTMTDLGPEAAPTRLLRRGDWRRPGREVTPAALSAIDAHITDALAPKPGAKTTGRRAALAEWMTQSDNPLTARVMVNRLWQHHFGRGIVATPSDLGVQGDPPTHPELLDWLAREFSENGWSVKSMHRLMVTSATYRQASRGCSETVKADSDNKLLGRMNRRRLEGEALRDAMLSVSGKLNLKAGGPSIYPELPAELGKVDRWPVSPEPERDRRSAYVFVKRNLRFPMFSVLDAPDGNETCPRRNVTTTAPQALMLLNDKWALEEARWFAGRLLSEAGAKPQAVIDRAYRQALGRAPDADELKLMTTFLDKESTSLRPRLESKNPPLGPLGASAEVDPAYGAAVVDLSHALLNLNEFLYVD
jgi:hypothetical protein